MKKVAILVSVLLAVLLLGCAQQPAQKPPEVKTITIGVTDKVTELDPANAYDFYTWEVLNNIMGGLMKYKPGTTELEPYLAESYEVQEDGKVYIFHLRKDLKFADGTPCKAQDVVRSIKRVIKIAGDPSWLVTDFVEDVVAVDDYTVKFVLKKPCSYFLALVATPPYFPVHPAYKANEIDPDQTAGGVGPYKIVKWVRDQELILETNPNFFGEKPKTDRIVVRFYKDATTLRLAIEKGEIDIAWRTLTPVDIQSLKKNKDLNVIEAPGAFIRYLVLNGNESTQYPTKNKLVRQAIAAAIDRNDIAERVFMGTVEPLYSLIPKGMWSHLDVFKEKYGDGNLDLARKLLKEAGYSEDNKVKIELWWTPTHYGDTEKDLAQVLKEQLEKTGMIEVELKSAEWSTYVDYSRKGAMMAPLFGWYPDYLDPDDYTTPFLKSGANRWLGYPYSDPEMDELLKKAATASTIEERTKYYEKIQQKLAEDAPIIPLIQGKLTIVAKKNIQGIVLDPTMLLRYYLLYTS
ncbi:MAG: peptide ABC transporter substrate-binding protein [Candidatus Methanomethylicota archaeon]|uniref:Peptide ABC transporter substrate-binding protein n=1 Tax=Thermoproteota archaeon TaxID=2056631 RepID=A0A497EKF8_9CREN|nr:MAG: peptide ABC transporter substrate-binding protein [Candidatus Verstraetearchaeota archaeon]